VHFARGREGTGEPRDHETDVAEVEPLEAAEVPFDSLGPRPPSRPLGVGGGGSGSHPFPHAVGQVLTVL